LDNAGKFADLGRLPTSVTGAIKDEVMRGFPVRVDGPGQVAFLAYDNNTLIFGIFSPDGSASENFRRQKIHQAKKSRHGRNDGRPVLAAKDGRG
jgi:hypothetical protein